MGADRPAFRTDRIDEAGVKSKGSDDGSEWTWSEKAKEAPPSCARTESLRPHARKPADYIASMQSQETAYLGLLAS